MYGGLVYCVTFLFQWKFNTAVFRPQSLKRSGVGEGLGSFLKSDLGTT